MRLVMHILRFYRPVLPRALTESIGTVPGRRRILELFFDRCQAFLDVLLRLQVLSVHVQVRDLGRLLALVSDLIRGNDILIVDPLVHELHGVIHLLLLIVPLRFELSRLALMAHCLQLIRVLGTFIFRMDGFRPTDFLLLMNTL